MQEGSFHFHILRLKYPQFSSTGSEKRAKKWLSLDEINPEVLSRYLDGIPGRGLPYLLAAFGLMRNSLSFALVTAT